MDVAPVVGFNSQVCGLQGYVWKFLFIGSLWNETFRCSSVNFHHQVNFINHKCCLVKLLILSTNIQNCKPLVRIVFRCQILGVFTFPIWCLLFMPFLQFSTARFLNVSNFSTIIAHCLFEITFIRIVVLFFASVTHLCLFWSHLVNRYKPDRLAVPASQLPCVSISRLHVERYRKL